MFQSFENDTDEQARKRAAASTTVSLFIFGILCVSVAALAGAIFLIWGLSTRSEAQLVQQALPRTVAELAQAGSALGGPIKVEGQVASSAPARLTRRPSPTSRWWNSRPAWRGRGSAASWPTAVRKS